MQNLLPSLLSNPQAAHFNIAILPIYAPVIIIHPRGRELHWTMIIVPALPL
jgi:hypothetical protein